MICGTSCSTLDFAPEEPDLSTPRSFSQPSALSAAAVAWAEIDDSCEVIPPITITSTNAPMAARPRSTIAAAAARGMCRASMPTIGIATAATIVAATTGPTIVYVVPSSQMTPARSAKKPMRSHEVRPRSRSQRGAANVDASSPASAAPSSNRAGSTAAPSFFRRCFRTSTAIRSAR
jgi:hypothetical protein